MTRETITLELREATTAQLEKALAEAKKGEQACRDQKSFPQAWQRRRELLETVLAHRPTPQPVVPLSEVKEALLEAAADRQDVDLMRTVGELCAETFPAAPAEEKGEGRGL